MAESVGQGVPEGVEDLESRVAERIVVAVVAHDADVAAHRVGDEVVITIVVGVGIAEFPGPADHTQRTVGKR